MSKPESSATGLQPGKLVSHLLDDIRNKRAGLALISLAIVGVTLLTAQGVLPLQLGVHAMYLPTLLAAYYLGLPGAVVTALAAAALMGVAAGFAANPEPVWLLWFAAYPVAGVLAAALLDLVDKRRRTVLRSQIDTLRSFAEAVETDDESAGAHCQRVAVNACTLGRALGLRRHELDELYWAGLLHDIGKVTVPREILRKPGGLTLEEYLVMRRHARLGANLLKSIETFSRVAEGVGAHHERWDGSGYPSGIKGEAIPLFGRILAVVDVFEALTSDRPYRPALPREEALRELRSSAGSQFDPGIVAQFESLYLKGQIEVAPQPATTAEQPRLDISSAAGSFSAN